MMWLGLSQSHSRPFPTRMGCILSNCTNLKSFCPRVACLEVIATSTEKSNQNSAFGSDSQRTASSVSRVAFVTFRHLPVVPRCWRLCPFNPSTMTFWLPAILHCWDYSSNSLSVGVSVNNKIFASDSLKSESHILQELLCLLWSYQ